MTSLQINGSSAAATTLAAAGKLFSATGGTSGNVSTKVGTSTQFKQIFAKGTTTTQTGVASLPAPTDSNFAGWMWDVTTLEGQNILAGTWTPTFSLLASTSTTVTPTVQWYKRSSGGVYTQIGSVTGSSIALTTSAQSLTFTPPSLSLMNCTTGDKLCMWLWVNQTAGGATNSTISVVEDTGGTAGVASAAQTTTPGYGPALIATLSGTSTLSATFSLGLAATLSGTSTLASSDYAFLVQKYGATRYYRLDEATGTSAHDSGTQAQNGTIASGVTLGAAGLLTTDTDPAMTFNGSSGHISLPTTGLPTGASALSLSCVLSTTSLPNASSFFFALDLGTVANSEELALYTTNSQIHFGFHNAGDIASGTITANTTYYVAGTFDGTNLRLYVNGSLVAGPTAATSPNLVYGGAEIGTQVGNGAFLQFPGTLDEVAIFPTTLTPTQASTLYLTGIGRLVLSGECDGAGTLSATLGASGVSLAATLSGTSTLAGTMGAATTLSATCAGTGTLSGTFSASAALAATCASMGTLTETVTLAAALAVQLSGTGQLSPVLSSALALPSVTLSGVGTLTPSLAATTALAATCAGAGTLAVTSPALSTALAVPASGVGTLAAMLSATTTLTGECDGSGILTGALTATTGLIGEADGTGSLLATLSASAPRAVTLTGIGTLVATLGDVAALAGTLAGSGTLAGTVSLTTALAGECDGVGLLAGTLSTSSGGSVALTGECDGVSVLAPTLSASLALPSIQLPGSGQLTTSLTASAPLAVTCAGTSQLAMSAPSLSTTLAETLTGAGTLAGMLLASLSMTATCAGDGTCTGSLAQQRTTLVALCAGTGTLAMGNPFLTTALAGKSRGQGMLVASVTLMLYALDRATTWTTRDLAGTWQARDLSATWRTRDTTDTWQTRDHRASWEARDLVTTWKED